MYSDDWINYQNTNKTKIIKTDVIDKNTIKYIGGLDISFSRKKENEACAYITYKRAMLLYVFLLETLTVEDRTNVIRYYYDNISKMET